MTIETTVTGQWSRQSRSAPHVLPRAQGGQLPPQSTSVSSPSLLPSVQAGAPVDVEDDDDDDTLDEATLLLDTLDDVEALVDPPWPPPPRS